MVKPELERAMLAFLFAPLVVPAMWLAYFLIAFPLRGPGPVGPALAGLFLFASLFASYAYLGTFLLGLPLYLLARARGWTAIWTAALGGFIAGALLIFATLTSGKPFGPAITTGGTMLALVLGGPAGAAVGTVLWLIARPDLRDGGGAQQAQ